MSEFDYQWKNLPDPALEYAPERVQEFLDYVRLPAEWFKGKNCLDAGCGNGRWTWAMMQLGAAYVISIDASKQAVKQCLKVNPLDTFHCDLLNYSGWMGAPGEDFVFCWGVLHHMKDPMAGFMHLAHECVKPGGHLHVMVYHKEYQKKLWPYRKIWRMIPGTSMKLAFAWLLARHKGTSHGWWDALNPKYNHGFSPLDVRRWFWDAGYTDIVMTKEFNINMRGKRHEKHTAKISGLF